MKSSATARQGALRVYEAVKDDLGEGVKVAQGIIKKEFEYDGWKYTFYIENEKLLKLEAMDHRESIEIWMQ